MTTKELREVMESVEQSADLLSRIPREDFLEWISEARSAIVDLAMVVRELVDKATPEQ